MRSNIFKDRCYTKPYLNNQKSPCKFKKNLQGLFTYLFSLFYILTPNLNKPTHALGSDTPVLAGFSTN